jgi:2,4-dienoyl-CoA reductase-like NADH-dependent reductase (Old Yellow Enzyme family)
MCQYSSKDGYWTDYHLVHLGQFALRGYGLIITEATAVTPNGRISPLDAGIWKDDHIPGMKRITEFIHAHGGFAGIQLAHAGRKASTVIPWTQVGPRELVGKEEGGWEEDVVGPSALAWDEHHATPREMTTVEVEETIMAFVEGAVRADKAGFDVIELHFAHGYLATEFLSPVSNQRTDKYGGSFDNRIRFVVETVQAVRAVWPVHKPLFVRLSATEWLEYDKEKFPESWTLEDTVKLVNILKEWVDVFDLSSAGNHPSQKVVVSGPGFQAPFALKVKQETGATVMTVGIITDPKHAEQLIGQGVDLVAVARQVLREPSWLQRAAQELDVDVQWTGQYQRAKPRKPHKL